MRKVVLYIVSFIWMLGNMASCTDELTSPQQYVEEGLSGELTLSLASLSNKNIHVSRGVSSEENEKKINNLRVYVFRASDGALIGYTKFVDEHVPAEHQPFTISTKSGEAYIYAVANLGTTQYNVSESDFKLLDIQNVETSDLHLAGLKKIKWLKQSGALEPKDDVFLMSGCLNDGKLVTLTKDSSRDNLIIIEGETVIKMRRIVSRNKLTLNPNLTKNNMRFKLLSYRICNVPLDGDLFQFNGKRNTPPSAVEDLGVNFITTGENTIEFYLPENLPTYSNPMVSIGSWKEREKNTYTSDGGIEKRNFTLAAPNSSYIELAADYDNKNDKISEIPNQNISADLKYTIHFGDFGGGAATSNWNNFDVVRNYKYDYLVTINGVNDLVVEAKAEEDNPYVEGDVVNFTKGHVFELDAHYEARILRFDQKKGKEKEEGYLLYYNTPFVESKKLWVKSTGVYDADNEQLATFNNVGQLLMEEGKTLNLKGIEDDYEWAHFVVNNQSESETRRTMIVDYPGVSSSRTDGKSQVEKIGGRAILADNSQELVVMNVFELLHKLLTADDSYFKDRVDGTRCVYVTCFIDEFYYTHKTWDKYVNKPNRLMNIANHIDVSTDGHSRYSEVAYTLSQKSIKTFYDLRSASSLIAYGVETVSEEETQVADKNFPNNLFQGYTKANYDLEPKVSDNWWGRKSMMYALKNNLSWQQELYLNGGTQGRYKTVARACLSRNRDLNGNGTIDDDEVRWYLPGVDQLSGLWIGEHILPAETRLFTIEEMKNIVSDPQRDDSQYGKYHFYTASPQCVFWAEEGVSTSGTQDWSEARKVRCVRTLQSGNIGIVEPQKYYDLQEVDGHIQVSLKGKIDESVFRTYQGGPMVVAHERAIQNTVHDKFIINKNLLGEHAPRITQPTEYGEDILTVKKEAKDDVCSKELGGNWRVPNQRELALMVTVNNNHEENMNWPLQFLGEIGLWSRTSFTGAIYGNMLGDSSAGYKRKPGFGYTGNQVTVGMGERANVRCVRDVQ